jgi:hypothetical protein
MLGAGQADALQLRRIGHVTIVGIAGEELADTFEGPTFDFAGASWKPRRVAAFPAVENRPGFQRRGVLGSGFFRRFVVEVDPHTKLLRLHEPKDYHYSGSGEVLSLHFKDSTPIVEATIQVSNRPPIRAQFEIDTGCDGCLCLGSDFVSTNQLASLASQPDSGRRGVGGGTRTRTGHLPQLQLGQLKIDKPATSFFLEGSPVDPPLAGHIGLELLREFKVVFDYAGRRMILEKPR